MNKQKWSRSDRLGNILFLLILGLGLFAFVMSMILPDRLSSDLENRPLSQLSDVDVSGLWTGETGKEIDDWFSDQFLARDGFLSLNYIAQRMEGVSKIDDVYIGNNILMQEAPVYDAGLSDTKLQSIRDFAAKTGLPVNLQIVPTSIQVNQDHLPLDATSPDEAAAIADIASKSGDLGFVNSLSSLDGASGDYLYYKTDHHWTSLGAWTAYKDLASVKGWSADQNGFDVLPAASGFKGTLSAKTGDPFLSDSIEIWVPKAGPEYIMTRDGVKSRTMYSEEAMDQRDKYQVFTGANTGEITFEMDNDSQVRLLVFKDSYANSFLQFLIPVCRTITVIDPRYYDGDLNRLVEDGIFTDVLFLYNYATWAEDQTLIGVLNAKS